MKLFKKKEEREAEQQKALIAFVRSDEGRRCIASLLIDVRLREHLDPAVAAVKQQLVLYLDTEIRQTIVYINTEIAASMLSVREQIQAEIARHTNNARRSLTDSLAEHERMIAGHTKLSMAGLSRQLHHQMEVSATSLRQLLQAEKEKITRHAHNVRRDLRESLAEHEQEIVEHTRLSMAGVVYDILTAELDRLIRQEVKEFVRANPVKYGLTNREIAAANGISIRELKCRRRVGNF